MTKTWGQMTKTWGTIYHNAVARGEDHGYAAYLADMWEKTKRQRKAAYRARKRNHQWSK